MKQFDESDLAKNAGGLFEAATDAPVTITKHGKPRFVVMSIERFESLSDRSGSRVPLDVADMPEELAHSSTKASKSIFVIGDYL